jgi:CHASE1-domain containing sensor protein
MSWERGRAEIERLLDGELEQVTPSADVAGRLLANAEAHIGLASKGIEDDPAGALQLSYDAAPKASAALLAVQGSAPRHGAGTSR